MTTLENISDERLRKPEPARTGPIRNPVTDDAGSTHGAKARPDLKESPEPDTWAKAGAEIRNGGVDYGVNLGYQVINDQIAKAKDLAAQWQGPGVASDSGADWVQIANRLINAYRDLGAVAVDAVEKVVHQVSLPESTPAGAPAQSTFQTATRLKIHARMPVDIDLNWTAPPVNPRALALQGPSGAPVLDAIEFLRDAGGAIVLSIDVPEGCPPGVYTGAVVEHGSNAPVGTLSVRVGG